MARVVIAALVLLGIIMAVRWFARTPAPAVARIIRRLAVTLAIMVLIAFAATGRLHWLIALLGALAAGLVRLFPLLRYVPLLKQLWAHFQPKTGSASGPSSQQRSTVQARFIRMWLDHASGEMSGEVLDGKYKGRRLDDMAVDDLLGLLVECRRADQESADLLMAYLDRIHGDTWRERDSADAGAKTSSGSGRMTREEAYQVLGLEAGAGEQAIIEAHRRLMQKLHPDRGGSNYLAAKINQAKDLLVGKKP